MELRRLFRRVWPLQYVYAALYALVYRTSRLMRSAGAPRQSVEPRTLVIEMTHGGLGDSLMHSPLPRLAKESGLYDRVLISDFTQFRNRAHRRVVWELNPYVDGFTNAPGRTFQPSIRETARVMRQNGPVSMNVIDQIIVNYALDDGKRFHEPEMYYQPKVHVGASGKVIFDPNFVTPLNGVVQFGAVEEYFAAHHITVDAQFVPRKNAMPLSSCETFIEDQSFEEFCDILHSCAAIYCFASGTLGTAAALGKQAHVFCHRYIQPSFLLSKRHNYVFLD